MASDELRKKWGTIFMGEREATVEQLDAMQEPMRRERLKREQQEDYLERVRARAADRAREILGAAYAERQKVLEEARAEAEAERQKLIREGEALKAAGTAAQERAAAELAAAAAAREEAEGIREAAHDEGFQAGMEQAGDELREFRADLGQSLAVVLRAIDAQRQAIGDSWREELVELVRTAVGAGTGWLLDKEHEAILRSLVLEALNLLEDRATVTVRVNPEDEATVSDMFMAARERAPELKQWIVNGDAAVERGGLVAESVSGSVDSRREHFRELVDGILNHLALPVREDEEKDAPAVHELVEREVRKIATLAPEPDHSVEFAPDAALDAPSEIIPAPDAVPAVDTASASGFEPDLPPESDAAPASAVAGTARSVTETEPDSAAPGAMPPPAPDPAAPSASEPGAASISAEEPEPGRAAPPSPSVAPEPEAEIPVAPPIQEVRPEPAPSVDAVVRSEVLAEDLPEAWLPPLGEEEPHIKVAPPAAARPEADTDGYESTAAAAVFDAAPGAPAASSKENPSLAELEEELFPVENGDEREVLSNGGFLPGADDK